MRTFRKVVNLFKCKFPDHAISVRRVPLSADLDGDCSRKEFKFRIRIAKKLTEDQAIDAFLHEIAHILTWDITGDQHGMAWGKAYSIVYRIFLKEFLEKRI